MKITWFGTASVLMEIQGEKILFDPFFRLNKKLENASLKEFCDVDFIFNTHSHFDHLCDVPKIMPKTKAAIYGTNATVARLVENDINSDRIQPMQPYDTLQTKNAVITVYPAKHVKNDIPIIIKTAVWGVARLMFKRAHDILQLHNRYRMGGEIYAFEITAENKKILIFGSAGIDNDVKLPKNVDVLIWPYQGRSDMATYSLPIIEQIRPKMIILDHFDNAFPPITGNVNTNKFVRKLAHAHPNIKVIVPKFKEVIEI